MFSRGILDSIREKISLSQVVSPYVRLRKSGKEFVGLSPFCQEQTPSFYVNDEKGVYHCFSTGESGDIFHFLMKKEGVTFFESVEKLASQAGIHLPKRLELDDSQSEKILRILDSAMHFFVSALKNAQIPLDYLLQRGVRDQERIAFQLGYAPLKEGKALIDKVMDSVKASVEECVQAGLLVFKEGQHYPFFRDRIMIPIFNNRKRCIGFGARCLDNIKGSPKYINSAGSLVFHKKEVLFHFPEAVEALRKQSKDFLIVVEGYFDVISLAKVGIHEAVAPLGTALTQEHLTMLWKVCSCPVICFDADIPGKKAAWKALQMALPHLSTKQRLRFLFLPEGMDPDSFLRNYGVKDFYQYLDQSLTIVEMLWEVLAKSKNPVGADATAIVEKEIMDMIQQIPCETLRSHYKQDMTARMRDLLFRAKKWSGGAKQKYKKLGTGFKEKTVLAPSSLKSQLRAEQIILVALCIHPELADVFWENIVCFSWSDVVKYFVQRYLTFCSEGRTSEEFRTLFENAECLDFQEIRLLVPSLFGTSTLDDARALVKDLFDSLEKNKIEKEVNSFSWSSVGDEDQNSVMQREARWLSLIQEKLG